MSSTCRTRSLASLWDTHETSSQSVAVVQRFIGDQILTRCSVVSFAGAFHAMQCLHKTLRVFGAVLEGRKRPYFWALFGLFFRGSKTLKNSVLLIFIITIIILYIIVACYNSYKFEKAETPKTSKTSKTSILTKLKKSFQKRQKLQESRPLQN